MNKLIRCLPIAAFLLIVAIAYAMLNASTQGTRNTKAIGFSMTNSQIPDLSLLAFEGEENIKLSDWHGQAYAINVFASWCAPCKLEAPIIHAIAQDIPVIGINYRDEPSAARKFLHDFGNPYQRLARDDEGSYSIQLGVHGLPETFIIAPDGTILHHQQGPVLASDLKGVVGTALKKALRQKALGQKAPQK